jgi:hypothetical protein
VDRAPGSVGASSSCRDCNAASCNTEARALKHGFVSYHLQLTLSSVLPWTGFLKDAIAQGKP